MGELRDKLTKLEDNNGITGPWMRDLYDLLKSVLQVLDPETSNGVSAADSNIRPIRPKVDRLKE